MFAALWMALTSSFNNVIEYGKYHFCSMFLSYIYSCTVVVVAVLSMEVQLIVLSSVHGRGAVAVPDRGGHGGAVVGF